MSIHSNDITLTLSSTTNNSNTLSCVVGNEATFRVNIANHSLTNPLYNISINLSLPDGISFVSSTLIPSSNTIDSNYNNLISFINIKNLYPNEINYYFDITIKIDSYYRSNNLLVPYNYVFSQVRISLTGDSLPRGSYDSGNSKITVIKTSSITTLRYWASITYPKKYVKGAGTVDGETIDATSIFEISVELLNSSLNPSEISFNLNLPNGLRYIGEWQSSGTDALTFSTPDITYPNSSQDYVSINFNNAQLSIGSITTLTFKVAIWNNYTQNGIENSGSQIIDGSLLTSSLSIVGSSSSFITSFEIISLDLLITLTTETIYTDVSLTNEYIISYFVCEYYDLSNSMMYFIIPDGMSYSSTTGTPQPTSVTDMGTTIELIWNLGTLNSNTNNTLYVYSTTNSTYSSGDYVYSTDEFIAILNVEYTSPNSIITNNQSESVSLTILPPTISTNTLGYYYNNLTEKTFTVAAIGDYVQFNIIYDASTILAKQKDISIFDYPPLSITANDIINITTTGSIPSTITYMPVDDNGIVFPIGNLNENSYFTISFYMLVTEPQENSMIYNLVNCELTNTDNLTYSTRDSSSVYFGIPNLSITQTSSDYSCISLDSTLTYDIVIKNHSDSNTSYIVDGYNIDFTASIPNIFEITSTPTITGSGIHSSLSINDNDYTMSITQLEPNSSITISTPVSVNTTPIIGKEYFFTASITNGTAQAASNSYEYTYNQYPLTNTLILSACTATITKLYSPSIVKLYQQYLATITITFPSGCIAYNTNLTDLLASGTNSNFTNLLVNTTSSSYNITNSTLTVPLDSQIDTTSGPITYIITYNDMNTTANTINYEEDILTTSSINWSDTLSSSDTYYSQTNSELKIVVPGILSTKYQNNSTLGISYDTAPINCKKNNILNYKISLTNLGKSTAYGIIFSDTLPSNLTYVSNNINGNYNFSNHNFTASISSLDVNDTTDVIIQLSVNDATDSPIATNTSTTIFKPNNISENIYSSTNSNTTLAYNFHNLAIINKYQKNVTMGGNFTTSTLPCYMNQSLQYKILISNPFDTTITNISINDTFPEELTFVSFNPFDHGTLTLNNNVISTYIESLSPNSSIEFIYNLTLTSNVLTIASSYATINFNFVNSVNLYSINSNKVYTKLSGLGKGFLIY